MQINQPHRETDCLVTLATMLRDHAASLRIMLPADTTQRYDKNEMIDKNNSNCFVSILSKPAINLSKPALLFMVFFLTKTSFEGAIFYLFFLHFFLWCPFFFFFFFFYLLNVFSSRACQFF